MASDKETIKDDEFNYLNSQDKYPYSYPNNDRKKVSGKPVTSNSWK